MLTLIKKQNSRGGWYAACLWGMVLTLSLRIGLGLVMAGSLLSVGLSASTAHLTDPPHFGKLPAPDTIAGDLLLGVWPRWDGVHHLNLAMHGYAGLSEGDSVFYPLYAILTHAAAHLTGENYILAGLIISTLSSFVLFTCLYRLADMAFGANSARWAVLVLAVYPTALFFVAPFTESLFLALTLAAFLATYRQKWWLAGALAFFASLTRGPGMLTALAFAVIAWQQLRTLYPSRPSWRQIAAFAWGTGMPVLGGLTFIAWRSAAGYAPMSDILQRFSGLVLTNPISGLAAAIGQWLQVFDIPTTLDVVSAVLFCGLTTIMFFKARWRKWDWLVFVIANLFLGLSKQSYMASSLQSLSRYGLILFPIFIMLGDWLSRRSQLTQFIYITISGSLLIVLSVLYTFWVFIG